MRKALIIIFLAVAALGIGGFIFMNKEMSVKPHEDTLVSAEMMPPHESAPPENQKPANPEPEETLDLMPMPDANENRNYDAKPSPQQSTGHFEISIPSRELTRGAEDDDNSELLDRARENKIWNILRKKSAPHAKWVKIKDLSCRAKVCTFEAQAKTSNTRAFQAAMIELPKLHPWIGNKIDVTTPIGDPSRGKFIYFDERAK